MSHYEKLAATAFRVVGMIVIAYALVGWIYILLTSRNAERGTLASATLVDAIYVILGVLLFVLSKRLAALAAKGLDNQ